ncbi:MAG: hypothetical protein HKN87_20830 [Saprospiraceae bacterium]|nr:hypothetical protein [Saprospiraceae bacterium]
MYAKQRTALARSIGNDTLVGNIPHETVQEAEEQKVHGQTWHIDMGNYPVTDKLIIDKRLGEIQLENQGKVVVGN